MIAPLHPTPLSFNIAIGVLGAVQSILVDIILLIRLVSVYPPSYIGKKLFGVMLALPVLLKIARVINLILFIKALADAIKNPATANLMIAHIWEHAPYLKIEWFAQLFDNTCVARLFSHGYCSLIFIPLRYASAGFLYRLALHNRDHNRVMSHRTSESEHGVSHHYSHDSSISSSASFADTLKTLLWVAATNFVVPVLFSLVQIIVVYRDIDVLIVNDIVLINTSIAVIGVVFATVWAGTTHWVQDRSQTALGVSEPSRVVFQHQSEFSEASTERVEERERVNSIKASESAMEFKVEPSV